MIQGRIAGANNWRRGVSLAAMALALGAAGAAAAQTDDAEVEEVVVTGFRGSLASAINVKRQETQAVDVIKAEDIADFPDLNLSESIQRIPGIAIQRDAGEGRQISVRGLGPQFTRVRINGMEALSTVGGTDAAGGTNRERGFDFNVFASDLFNSITVRKSASASTEEGSLGATVDLQVARPLDYDGFTFAASGQYGYNDLSEKGEPRGALLIANTWADGTFGALFSVAYAERSQLEEGASTVRWRRSVNAAGSFGPLAPGYSSTPTLAQINDAFRPRIPRYDIYEHDQKRLGMTASLQWKPSDRTQFSLDMLYADYDAERSEIFLESHVFSTDGASGINDVNPVAAAIDGGSLVYGVFDDVDIRSEARFDELATTFKQITLSGSHEFNERFRVSGLAGFSKSEHDNPVQTTLLFDANNVDGYAYDYRTGEIPLITYGTANVASPSTWTLSQIRLRPQTADNEYKTLEGSAVFDATDWLSLKGGAQWKKYEFATTELRRDPLACTPPLAANGNAEPCIPASVAATPISSYSRLVTFTGDGLDVPAGTVTTWLIPDIDAANSLFGLDSFPLSRTPALGNNRSVEEEATSFYLQADFRTEIAGLPVRGDVGVRHVKTEQSSTGFQLVAGAPAQTTVERDYSDTLPAMNVVLEVTPDLLLRFAAAKVMSRPGIGNLTPGGTVTASGANRTITAGNPFLKPFEAVTIDASIEWYFAPQSLLSFAVFQKDIDTLVTTVQETLPNFAANPFGLPDSVATSACGAVAGCSAAATWNLNVPRNTPGPKLQGFEISYQQPFTFLPGLLSNTGFTGNLTRVKADTDYFNSSGALVTSGDLLNLSRRSWNATLYYEDTRLSARVSAAYRSKYLTNIPGRDNNVTEETGSTLNFDASASYQINDNWKVTFEALNLTDEVSDQYLTPDDRLSFYHHYGRQYFVGFRYTF